MVELRIVVPNYPIGKSQCPACARNGSDRSMDNLIKYSDGHSYCFACKYLEKGDRIFVPLTVKKKEVQIRLPDDCQEELPFEPATWLAQYNITREEVKQNFIKWSPAKNLLVFPFYGSDTDELVGWQGRSFKVGYAKYHTQGPVDSIFWFQNLPKARKSGIILVEDCVSAMKVGRYGCACPLLGSNLPIQKRTHLRFTADCLTFWLDYDKRKDAYKYAQQCQVLGYKVNVIVTEKDPKEVDEIDLEDIVKGIKYD